MGISFNRGSDWGTWRRARVTGTFDRGGLPCWGPLEVGRKDSGDGHLSYGVSAGMGNPERAHLSGTLICGRKGLWGGVSLSLRELREGNLGRGSCDGEKIGFKYGRGVYFILP
jgi:hypothetical protein